MRILALLLFPALLFAQLPRIEDTEIYWDAAKTDTQWAIRGTDSLFSQPFRVATDMTLITFIQAGDTAATLDSSKVRIYAQYGPSSSGPWKYAISGVSTYGVDSTGFDSGANLLDGSPGGTLQPYKDISVAQPIEWARLAIAGLGTNCKASGDSTKGSCHVKRYTNPQ